MGEPRKYDLEDRLVKFAIMILEVCDLLPGNRASNNLEHQLSKSGTAPALMYGEAQAAESRADFIHKMKILLKELRETRISLRIIMQKRSLNMKNLILPLKNVMSLLEYFQKV